jgi:hypothetical protein
MQTTAPIVTPADLPAEPPSTATLLVRRVVGAALREGALARFAIGVVALHVVDDNFVQPNAGMSAGDHLVSGLVPLAILTVLAALYPRVRAGAQASLALTLGLIGIAFGVPAAYYLRHGGISGDHYTGLLALVAGAVLLLSGPLTLWRKRRRDGSRGRRYLRRLVTAAAVPVLIGFVAFPVAYSYIYTHTGRALTTPDLRVPYEQVTVTTSDSLTLTGSAASASPSAARSCSKPRHSQPA